MNLPWTGPYLLLLVFQHRTLELISSQEILKPKVLSFYSSLVHCRSYSCIIQLPFCWLTLAWWECSVRVCKEWRGNMFEHSFLVHEGQVSPILAYSGAVCKIPQSFAPFLVVLISILKQSESDSGVGWYEEINRSRNVETGHSDLYSMISLFFKEQKNPTVYHVLVGLLSYRLLEFELQSYGVNPAVISQGSS